MLQRVADHNPNKNIKFIGVEVENDMVDYANNKLQNYEGIEIICDDILNVDLEKSDMIISYYTIQFIKKRIRQLIFDKIYESLNWGGAFVLFEKVRGADARFQDISTALYTDFKLEQGFTKEEILEELSPGGSYYEQVLKQQYEITINSYIYDQLPMGKITVNY